MLPDFPKIKDEIRALFMTALYLSDPQFAPLSGGVPRRRYHEGMGGTLVRADGSTDTTDPQQFSAQTTWKFEEFGQLTLKESFERIKETMSDLARQREVFFIEKIKEAVESVGNDIDARGRPMDPELVMEAMERLQVDFDGHGNPIWPTFVLAPEMAKKFESVLKQLEKEPYLGKMNALVEMKRREWHDRESRRKLVD